MCMLFHREHPSGVRVGLHNNNLLLRSCTIRNTETVVGIVVYAGKSTASLTKHLTSSNYIGLLTVVWVFGLRYTITYLKVTVYDQKSCRCKFIPLDSLCGLFYKLQTANVMTVQMKLKTHLELQLFLLYCSILSLFPLVSTPSWIGVNLCRHIFASLSRPLVSLHWLHVQLSTFICFTFALRLITPFMWFSSKEHHQVCGVATSTVWCDFNMNFRVMCCNCFLTTVGCNDLPE